MITLNLGTDPEFLLVHKKTGGIIDPRLLLEDDFTDRDNATAIGIDGNGNRQTASVEFRPGISSSAEVLVNRIGDLMRQFREHYNSSNVKYRAGAYWGGESLGGHIHISWLDRIPKASMNRLILEEFMDGMNTVTKILHPLAFKMEELEQRGEAALRHDWGKPNDYRPTDEGGPLGRMDRVIQDQHLEFRYPASWLATPELAYIFLGSAELIGKICFNSHPNELPAWQGYVMSLLSDVSATPTTMPNFAKAYTVVQRQAHREKNPDLRETWLG